MSLGPVALLTSGAIGDEVGRRRIFVAGAVLLAVGSAACGLAPGPAVFVAGRIVQGVGSAAVIACGLAPISHTLPGCWPGCARPGSGAPAWAPGPPSVHCSAR